ncbi:hypothetical protein ACC674_15315 [Rhizobium ruizarguesonis]
MVAEVESRAWTQGGKLRHASYKGLRDVQDNAAVARDLGIKGNSTTKRVTALCCRCGTER